MNITNEDNIQLMARYEDNYFDLAIVDPPYGIERFKKVTNNPSSKDVHAKRFQNMQTVNDTKPFAEYWNELFRVSKNQIVWGANNFNLPQSEYFLVWDKKQAVPNFARCELAYVSMGLKKPAKIFEWRWHGFLQQNMKDKQERIHPTEKPIKLYEWLLMNYAKEGDKILDTHLGSGSIALACHNLKFDLTACELDTEYYNAAMKRIREHQQQIRMF